VWWMRQMRQRLKMKKRKKTMALKPESIFYKRLKENVPDCHFTRIESRVNLGIPDCLLAFPHGLFVMAELKVVKRGRKIALSPHQVAFHIKHADLRCPTYILVQYFPPGVIHASKSELLLYCGEQALDVARLGIDTPALARWPWTAISWSTLRAHLVDS
jgi:hypothetical protein